MNSENRSGSSLVNTTNFCEKWIYHVGANLSRLQNRWWKSLDRCLVTLRAGVCRRRNIVFSLIAYTVQLGLTKDNTSVYEERLELWKQFNVCWLAFLTRQLANSWTVRESRQPLSGGQTVVSKGDVKTLDSDSVFN